MSFRNFSSVIKAVDLFAVDVSFRENKGKSFTSILGGAVSIIIYAIATLYAINKTVILINNEDTNFTQYTMEK